MVPTVDEVRAFAHKYKNLCVLGAACFFAELAYAILNLSAMPMYVEYVLDRGSALGLIISTFLLTEAVSRPAFGALGDRIGRKPLLIAGPAITALTSYLTIKFQSPFILVGLRAIDGLGSGALWPSAFATISDIVEEDNRSAAMSVLNVTYMSGLALGFLMGGAVNQLFGSYLASFYLVTLLLAMAVLILLFAFPGQDRRPHHVEHREEAPAFKLRTLLRSFREVPEMLVLACVIFFGIGMLMPVIKLYAIQHLRMSETTFGAMIAPVAAVMGIFAVPLGRLGDRYGKCVAVCWGLFASAIAMWVLALFKNIFSLHYYIFFAAASGAVLALGFTIAFPAWMALVSMSTAASRRGEVLGAVGMAQGLAAIIGTSLGTFIYFNDAVSFPLLGIRHFNAPFWFSAVLLSVGAVMAFTWVCGCHGHKDPGDGVSAGQRRLITTLAALGLVWIAVWIPYRYLAPAPPGRVAMSWVHELALGKPMKAMKYASADSPGWDGATVARAKSALYRKWGRAKGIYDIGFPRVRDDTALVPVEFAFPGTKQRDRIELITLCRAGAGQWKVCGVRSRVR